MHTHLTLKLKKPRAVTLTELLVASVLIGIVMLGVASFSLSIRQLQGSTNKTALVKMKTKAAMARMARDANRTVGEETNRGVVAYSAASHLSICFRNDLAETSDNYNDDTWKCYYRNSAQNRLIACGDRTFADVPVQNGGGGAQGCARGGDRYLLDLDPANNTFFSVVQDANSRLEYIQLTIAAIYDQQQAFHAIDNPMYTATTRVSPRGHSR